MAYASWTASAFGRTVSFSVHGWHNDDLTTEEAEQVEGVAMPTEE